MRKILLASFALALAATSAMAAPRQRANSAATAARADVVVQDGVIIGQDPDSYVRFELLRTAAGPSN